MNTYNNISPKKTIKDQYIKDKYIKAANDLQNERVVQH